MCITLTRVNHHASLAAKSREAMPRGARRNSRVQRALGHFGWRPPAGRTQIAAGLSRCPGQCLGHCRAAACWPRPSRRCRRPPARSPVLFLATTSEEQGLLRARYYARHPLFPLRDNRGGPEHGRYQSARAHARRGNHWLGKSDMDDRAAGHGRGTGPRGVPERIRSAAVSSVPISSNSPAWVCRGSTYPTVWTFIGKPPDYGEAKRSEFIAKRYHQVGDVIQPDWTLEGRGAGCATAVAGRLRAGQQHFVSEVERPGASSRHDATCSGPATERAELRDSCGRHRLPLQVSHDQQRRSGAPAGSPR